MRLRPSTIGAGLTAAGALGAAWKMAESNRTIADEGNKSRERVVDMQLKAKEGGTNC